MKVLIIEPDQSSDFDNALSESNSFVRFHSPTCGHCVAMKEEMEKLKKHSDLKDIDDLNIIDAHTGVTRHSNHPVCNMHDGAVPAMYMVIKGEEPEEYDGDRNADAMARFIGEKIGGYNKMKGGKKQEKQRGGNKSCDAGDDFCRRKDGEGECESYMDLQHLGADVLMSEYEECEPEPSASSAPVAADPAPVASKPAATPMQAPQSNFGTYRDVVRQPDEYDDGMGDVPCKTQCGDHGIGHGLASMVGLGDLTHATCEGEDGKQHKCKKAQSAGKKRKTRKHKKKAKKAHKKKTHKRKPKRKSRKHKKKAKKAHKKKTHKRKHRSHKKK